MKKIELYEPAMCCQTGICGPSIDPQLLEVAGIFDQINRSDQWQANRYNLAQNPQDFVENGTAIKMIHKNGKKCLPITFVEGEIVKSGEYPSLNEFEAFTGLSLNHVEGEINA
ncbi:arsenite efflux transporter metallochaperone ArsD [Facklamia sp. 7083-14-GEN3]|uniref:arsenite efflux transporter metallochaperone ArsD n=1 Tax=Facklamia sp. 7083-14-GEN3 TaxID=2973478 RepID=UPI00215D0933|nr:arsenite efflux transporter metallochaperone ArsD [Facklamia sp. 7083-14-GEN3]MCR8968468.1 arsenite efflux transporter metallochaperone ArsD [Facklamia sp. 7083-14-GEN3]